MAQAAVAVQTTKTTGRLAAAELLLNSHIPGSNPKSILRKLYKTNPGLSSFLCYYDVIPREQVQRIKALLP